MTDRSVPEREARASLNTVGERRWTKAGYELRTLVFIEPFRLILANGGFIQGDAGDAVCCFSFDNGDQSSLWVASPGYLGSLTAERYCPKCGRLWPEHTETPPATS
jgi:hypothetical protein